MDPLLLQQQLKNNSKDFLDFYNDLNSWGKEMEVKEQYRKPQKQQSEKVEPKLQEIKKQRAEESNRAKKDMLNDKKEVKKKCMSYSDWDKFDAEKECEKVDDSDSSSESLLEDLRDQALIEKEQGNKFVKDGNWSEAIISYSNAIKYYGFDPIFYANRALCFLKTNQMEKAEQDCTVSLHLDNTYVKAYQRRALARESLNKLEDARMDLLRVLEFEPKNSESKKKLEELTQKTKLQRPVSKFSESRKDFKRPSSVSVKEIDSEQPKCIWPSGEVDNIVKAIQKPPHMRSTKPLVRIPVQEINSAISESPELPTNFNTINIDDIKIIEHKDSESTKFEQTHTEKIEKMQDNSKQVPTLTTPKTSVQFHLIWKQLKWHSDKRGEYLRMVNPKNIPNLFKDSLESDVFSEILLVLAEHFAEKTDETYEYLLNLSKIKRFSALSMFLTLKDKNSLWKIFNHMKEFEGRSKEEIDILIKKFEL